MRYNRLLCRTLQRSSSSSTPSLAETETVNRCLRGLEVDGFAITDTFLSRSSVLDLRREVDEILRTRAVPHPEQWLIQIHQLLPKGANWMWDIATCPLVVSLVSSFLGPCPLLYCSQISDKSAIGVGGSAGARNFATRAAGDSRKKRKLTVPKDGARVERDTCFQQAVPWHQDGDSKVVTLWIPLDDVDETNGGLRVLRGAHVLGRLPWRKVQSAQELRRAEALARHNVFEVDLRALIVGKGETGGESEIRFKSRCVVYGSGSNDGNADRDSENRRGREGGKGMPSKTKTTGDRQEGESGHALAKTYAPFQYKMKAGGLAMHHPLLPHSSPANTSTRRRRRVIILRFHAAGEKQVFGWVRDFRDPQRRFRREVLPVYVGAAPPTPAKPEVFIQKRN